MIDTHLPRPPCRLDPAIVPGNHQRRARFANHSTREANKGNEVIGRDLEFGIGTMAREHDEDTGRKAGDDDDEGGRRDRGG